MATITVNSLADNTIADDGNITLREAIMALNANHGAGNSDFAAITFDDIDDEILFTGLIGTITLGGTELQITEELTLTGPGADDLTIDANMASRVINVTADVPLTVAGLTVTGGMTTGNGGGILSNGEVTLTNSTVSSNSANEDGGSIASAEVTLTNSTVSDNSANDEIGGIFSNGEVTLTNSTVSGNSANRAGGIFSNGEVTLTNSTVSDNTADQNFGGILSNGEVTLTNSTVSGNSTGGDGGGIYSRGGGTIDNSTITNNTADAENDGDGDGGGIFNDGGTLTIRNSIIAGNTDMGGEAADVSGDGINGDNNNILGTATGNGNGTIGTGSDRVLDTLMPALTIADILNTTLADNGGSTFTHALVAGSIAIDASGAGATANDQRGVAAFGTRDIGAFEFAPEIDITGNGVSIADGDTTPATGDDTDFGSTAVSAGTVVRTFTIANQGNINLSLSGYDLVSLSGPNAADFSITAMPTATVAAGGSTTFQVTFDPSAAGVRTATVTVESNDSDENPYTFDIQGTGNAPEIDITGNNVSIADGDTTPDAADDTDFGSTTVSGGTVVGEN